MIKRFPYPKRSWFRYRLKTLFVLVVAIAVPCGGLKWTLEGKRKERAAIAAIIEAGGKCLYRWQTEPGQPVPGPMWLRRLLGEDFFTTVERVGFRPGSKDLDAIMMNYIRNLQVLLESAASSLGSRQSPNGRLLTPSGNG